MPVQSDAVQQLSSIPFGALIGGPLNAAVEAQAQAAKTSIDFIQTVGFNNNGEAKSVVFTYEKDGNIVKLIVPILSIVPIPYIRVEDLTIAFKANISAETNEGGIDTSNNTLSGNTSGSGRFGWGFWGIKSNFNASYSSKKDSTATRDSRYSVEYTMDIHCRAVQDSIPAGLSSVLSLLHESIAAKPVEGTLEFSPAEFKVAQGSSTTLTVTAKDYSEQAVSNIYISLSCENEFISFIKNRIKTDSTGKAEFTVKCTEIPPELDKTWTASDVIATTKIVATGANFAGTHPIKIVGANTTPSVTSNQPFTIEK